MKQLRNFSSGNSENRDRDEAFKKYSGMDEDKLISELVKMIEAQKANGTFNPAQLSSYSKMLAPHLSREQKQKLENIMKIIALENE